ncbi:MAG: glycerophosphodiester phosphodiesterase, partial [Aquificaceae bacterium]
VDIQRTRDGMLVLSHDEDLQRVYGVRANIRESLWEDLRKIEKDGYRLASLEEALELTKGRVGMLLEIKNPEDALAVLDLLERKKVADWTALISFYPQALEKVKGKVATGLLYSNPPGMIPEAKKLGCSFVLPKYMLATQKAVDFAHRLKLKVIAWTVNDLEKAKELFQRGVDGIATDNVELLRKGLYLNV